MPTPKSALDEAMESSRTRYLDAQDRLSGSMVARASREDRMSRDGPTTPIGPRDGGWGGARSSANISQAGPPREDGALVGALGALTNALERQNEREKKKQSDLERSAGPRLPESISRAEAEFKAQGNQTRSQNAERVSAASVALERKDRTSRPLGGIDQAGRDIMGAFGGAKAALAGFAGGLPMAAIDKLRQGLDMASNAMNVLGDSTLSASQKQRKFIEAIDPTGIAKAVNNFRDAISGVADQFRMDAISRQQKSLLAPMHGALDRQKQSLGIEQAGQGAYVAALGRMPAQVAVGGDRTTIAGERQYERERMMVPLVLQRGFAEAQVEGARAARDAAAGNVPKARTELDELKDHRTRELIGLEKVKADADEATKKQNSWGAWAKRAAMLTPIGFTVQAGYSAYKELTKKSDDPGGPDAPGGRGDISRRATIIAKADVAIDQADKTYQTAINAERQRGVDLAEKESAVRKANLSILGAELALAERKQQRMHAQFASVGGMTRGQHKMAVRATRAAEKKGWGKLSPMQRQLARQYNPEKGALLDNLLGEKRILKDGAPADWKPKGTRASVDAEVRGADAAKRQAELVDAQKLAGGMAGPLNHFADLIIKAMEQAISAAERRFAVQQKITNNQK